MPRAPGRDDSELSIHAELLVRVIAHGAVHLVGPGFERESERGCCPRLDHGGLLLDPLPLDFEGVRDAAGVRSEEHTSELQSRLHLVCRLLLEKKKKKRRVFYLQ